MIYFVKHEVPTKHFPCFSVFTTYRYLASMIVACLAVTIIRDLIYSFNIKQEIM